MKAKFLLFSAFVLSAFIVRGQTGVNTVTGSYTCITQNVKATIGIHCDELGFTLRYCNEGGDKNCEVFTLAPVLSGDNRITPPRFSPGERKDFSGKNFRVEVKDEVTHIFMSSDSGLDLEFIKN